MRSSLLGCVAGEEQDSKLVLSGIFSKTEGVPRYLVCNADESEPGTFKDRYLMEKIPHLLIEGMIVSSYALGVNTAYIYIRGEYFISTK